MQRRLLNFAVMSQTSWARPPEQFAFHAVVNGSCFKVLRTDRYSSFPVWRFWGTVPYSSRKESTITMSHRLLLIKMLCLEVAHSDWRMLDRGWLYSCIIAHTFLSKLRFDIKIISRASHLSDHDAYGMSRAFSCRSVSQWYWNMNCAAWARKDCTTGRSLWGLQAILVRTLRGLVQSWRYSLAAFSASAFKTVTESLFRIYLANVPIREGIICITKALSLHTCSLNSSLCPALLMGIY